VYCLQQDEPVLVGAVVIEPAGSHNRVRQSAGAHQSLGAPLPVVSLGSLVLFAGAIGDSDGSHQRAARCARAQGAQDIANTAVINVFMFAVGGSRTSQFACLQTLQTSET